MDIPLTAIGREQARAVADSLRKIRLASILTSDQLRARQTAAAIAAHHPDLSPESRTELREQSLGVLEGRLARDLAPEPVPEGQHIADIRWGGGESLGDVAKRLHLLLEESPERFAEGDEVVIVSHGDTLRVLLALLDGRTHREVSWVSIDNCAIISRELR